MKIKGILCIEMIAMNVHKRDKRKKNWNEYELIAPCHFGLEAVLKKEVVDLGYEVTEVENGRVTFIGDAEAICRANIFLRTTERVLVKVGSFHAETSRICSREPARSRGRNISRRTRNSGSQRRPPSRASFSAV